MKIFEKASCFVNFAQSRMLQFVKKRDFFGKLLVAY